MPATSVFIPLIAFAMLAAPAFAQTTTEPQTRAEELRRQREEKERNLKPYEENGLERAMDLAEGRIYPLLIRRFTRERAVRFLSSRTRMPLRRNPFWRYSRSTSI